VKRRDFITRLGGAVALGAWPLAAGAQQPAKVPRIGVLNLSNPEPFLTLLRKELRDLGYEEGRNIQFEFRSAEGKPNLLPGLAAELIRLKVDVIVAYPTPAIAAVKQATREIPVVMLGAGDPVGTGLVASLSEPGDNITGTSSTSTELGAKTLELIRDVIPAVQRVAVLANAADPFSKPFVHQLELAGQTLHLQIQIIMIRGADDLDPAFAAMTKNAAEAVIVQPSLPRVRVADLALRNRIPAFSPSGGFVAEGGLAAYAASRSEMLHSTAVYVDKILKGSKPTDLPVEQPTQFELVINLKTAKALGLTIPPSLLVRADEVIE
jgi:putative ABC transport system substrate-binding protein